MASAEAAQVFGAESTAMDVVAGLDYTGKVVFITGTSAGIGVETARAFLSIGATVVGAVRNLEKMEPIANELKESTGNTNFEALQCDLASLESIKGCAAAFSEKYEKLDVLILNAGVMATDGRRETADGFEWQFGVNHLGHFLLTGLILPKMFGVEGGARVVSLSSVAHKRCGIMFDDLMFTAEPYNKWGAYGQAKCANVLFASELNRRYSGAGILAFSCHPGGIMTELGRELTDEDRARFAAAGSAIKWKTIPQGAATSTRAATIPVDQAPEGGSYWHDCQPVTERFDGQEGPGFYAANVADHAMSVEDAGRLWQVSEELVNQAFPEAPAA